MAALMMATGNTVTATPANGEAFTLQELYELIDAQMVEILPCGGVWLVVDEEGQLKGLPPNELASHGYGRPLVGDVLVCERHEID